MKPADESQAWDETRKRPGSKTGRAMEDYRITRSIGLACQRLNDAANLLDTREHRVTCEEEIAELQYLARKAADILARLEAR